MTYSKNSKSVKVDAFIGMIEKIVETFKSDEKLSEFERGQLDGMRWVIDLLNEIKNPED